MDYRERRKIVEAACEQVVSIRREAVYIQQNGGGTLSDSSRRRSCDEMTSTKFAVLHTHAELLKIRASYEDAIISFNEELGYTWELSKELQNEIDKLMPVIGE